MIDPAEPSNELIHDLAGEGVKVGRVLEIVRNHRAARDRARAVGVSAAVLGLIAALALFNPAPTDRTEVNPPSTRPALASLPEKIPQEQPAPFITLVDDEGLLELLKDQPVGLVQLPHGEQRLMVIVNAASDRPAAQP